jgi:hypothetical protein
LVLGVTDGLEADGLYGSLWDFQLDTSAPALGLGQ